MAGNKGIKRALTACIAGILLGVIPLVNTGTIIVNITTPNSSIEFFTGDGKTLYVGGSGPGNYTMIQDAVNNAIDGDVVFVFNESSPYYENIKVDKSIHLIGEDKNSTIINGNKIGDVVSISSDNVYLSGFTIQNSGDDDFAEMISVEFPISNLTCPVVFIISENGT